MVKRLVGPYDAGPKLKPFARDGQDVQMSVSNSFAVGKWIACTCLRGDHRQEAICKEPWRPIKLSHNEKFKFTEPDEVWPIPGGDYDYRDDDVEND